MSNAATKMNKSNQLSLKINSTLTALLITHPVNAALTPNCATLH